VTYRDGRPPKYHFVTVAQITKCQKCAQTQNVWTNWYEQMALKTIYRDAYSRRVVPIDPLAQARMEKVLAADDAILANDPRLIPEKRPAQAIAEQVLGKPAEVLPKPEPAPASEPEPPPPPAENQDAEPAVESQEPPSRMTWYAEEVASVADDVNALNRLGKHAQDDEQLTADEKLAVAGMIQKQKDQRKGKRP
jgi:hypothetical protein